MGLKFEAKMLQDEEVIKELKSDQNGIEIHIPPCGIMNPLI